MSKLLIVISIILIVISVIYIFNTSDIGSITLKLNELKTPKNNEKTINEEYQYIYVATTTHFQCSNIQAITHNETHCRKPN